VVEGDVEMDMMQGTQTVVDVTDADFMQTVVEGSKQRPVVVDLWASWCGPCKTLGPMLERVAEQRGGQFLLAKLDVDANPYTASQFGVQSIPTVIAFKDGKPVDGFIGAVPEPMASITLREWAQDREPGTLASAKRLASQGRWREALDGMIGALRDDPDARQAMLEVFTVLGDEDPLVVEYRRKLANALF
jgi:thioredoxin